MNAVETLIQNGAEIRSLSWKEPYGTLMLHGKIETRTWHTAYRGLVMICTSKRPYRLDQVLNISGRNNLDKILHLIQTRPNASPLGYAIAIGLLVECRQMIPEDEDKCFVKYYKGLWCHVYTMIKPIVPFSWKGKQGWSKIDPEIISSIIFVE